MTSVFVTHDQEEAFEVADQVVVMNKGRVEQAGTPQEVFEHPANPFVMDFLGNVNVFHGRVQNGRAQVVGMDMEYPEYPHEESRAGDVYIRPHELDIARSPNGVASLKAEVQRVNPAGSVAKIFLRSADFGVGSTWSSARSGMRNWCSRPATSFMCRLAKSAVFMPEYVI